ncbi:uncharacterized protein LOC105697415 isoform X3 [Orussus abietinus]|uniref:uncharacterized protein LOC105697415 isoform X3 n=1 Tax=Orussus abietinus TaxID=222816 RepID=UPI000625910A|nr:uncharacterized protein LOC105697415 isoform X3 [Orussus abietinus]
MRESETDIEGHVLVGRKRNSWCCREVGVHYSNRPACRVYRCTNELQSLVDQRYNMVERKFIPNLWNKARQNWPSKQLIIVHFLVICFGLSAWVGVNGIFVQLPLLVLSSPERWKLPAYLIATKWMQQM